MLDHRGAKKHSHETRASMYLCESQAMRKRLRCGAGDRSCGHLRGAGGIRDAKMPLIVVIGDVHSDHVLQ